MITVATILAAIGVLYCTVIGLMMMCVYLIILIRLTDYATHFDDYYDPSMGIRSKKKREN